MTSKSDKVYASAEYKKQKETKRMIIIGTAAHFCHAAESEKFPLVLGIPGYACGNELLRTGLGGVCCATVTLIMEARKVSIVSIVNVVRVTVVAVIVEAALWYDGGILAANGGERKDG